MPPRLRYLLSCVLTVTVVVMQSCLPTKSEEEEKKNNPTQNQPNNPIITPSNPSNNPEDLPSDIDSDTDVSETGIDSLFNLLVKRVENLENAQGYNDIFNADFESLRRSFGAAVNSKPNHGKANIGFIVSSVCALNTSSDLKKIVDSLDAYFTAYDEYYYDDNYYYDYEVTTPNSPRAKTTARSQSLSRKTRASTKRNTLSNTFDKFGVEGIGRVLLAETPKILMTQTQPPSFPRFLNFSFVQKIVENDVMPRLNDIVSACKRLEQSDLSIELTAFEETVEIDVGDIYLFEAGIRLIRAGLGYFTTYNMDIHAPDGSNSMKWLDDLVNGESYSDRYNIYRLNGDTLKRIYVSEVDEFTEKVTDLIQHNLQRSDFLAIRSANHQLVYSDLLAVPELIKEGIASMKNESDGQENDLIPAGDIFNLDADMVDLSQKLSQEGFSPKLTERLSSPEALMDFVTELLTQEYTFDENIDGYQVSFTINLSSWFTNPVEDLKTLYPKHRIPKGDDRYVTQVYEYTDYYSYDMVIFFEGDIIEIPESMIEEQTSNYIRLKEAYLMTHYIDSITSCVPVILVDDAGKDISYDRMMDVFDDQQALEQCFPYFEDYTFNGIFPRMTSRSAWIDFISQFYE